MSTQLPWMHKYKTGGITFTRAQLANLAQNIAKTSNSPLQIEDHMEVVRMVNSRRRSENIGHLLWPFHLPDGIDDSDKDEKDRRYAFLFLTFQELGREESMFNCKEIPFDENDESMKRAIAWFGKYGYSKEEMMSNWMTLSSWNFREGK